jgi:hypothetical protein
VSIRVLNVAERDEPAAIYTELRSRMLGLSQADLPELHANAPVLAVVMETGYPEAVATLVGLADGSTSLYFSNGGGTIGGGEHPQVAAATRRLVEVAASTLERLSPATEFPLPADGVTQLTAVTPNGRLSATASEDELGSGGHELSELFHAAQDVIAQLRLIDEETSG